MSTTDHREPAAPSIPSASATGAAAPADGGVLGRAPAPLLCVLAMVVLQTGLALATHLFGPLGVMGTSFLRLCCAAAVLLAATRPRLRGRSARDLAAAALLGTASAGMTLFFALATSRLPLGTAATLEFLGPLAVALMHARRASHLAWAVLAAGGVALLTLLGGGGGGGHALDPLGLGYGSAAAACYAGYIVATNKVGAVFPGFQGLAVSMTVGAAVLAPFGLAEAWHGLAGSAHPGQLLLATAGVAMLLPVIPYVLEMSALRRLQERVFSILLSLEPAVSTLVGFLLLGQLLGWAQLLGIACVVGASAGATLTSRHD
ncbi:MULTISPECIES: EamA family transporter [Kitasatospora]|uniref:EamA family transporter n=1 Tax=Kitasatospora TaxID=2063 RepID=UPI000CCA713C|nr:EamA family transporter [Kitasatospora sp. GP30]MDH6138128.1 inner membrane transporter RhtA [Kitasatospora sp. GP30]